MTPLITLITIVHIIVSILLILIVLLQIGKGANLSNLFGGGSGSDALLTSAGGDVFLKKFTVVLAVIFFLTSLSLTVISARVPTRSILDRMGTEATVPVSGDRPEGAVEETAPPSSETVPVDAGSAGGSE